MSAVGWILVCTTALVCWWGLAVAAYSAIDDDGALVRWYDERPKKSWLLGLLFWTGWPAIAYTHWRDYTKPRRASAAKADTE
jgi:hypothetical protein